MARKHSTWHVVPVKLAIAGALVALAACEGGLAEKSQDGAKVYQSICATCHGPQGKPTEAMIARIGVRDLTSAELRARVTPALVEAQVRSGSKNKLMPAFAGALNDAQIKTVAAYVASPTFPN
jgi:mono/diheme cytochrome c family protein